MKTHNLTRRTLLNRTAAAFAFAMCGTRVSAEDTLLRFMWWGTRERAELTEQAINAFQAVNPGIEVKTEYTSWLDYWQRFVTLVATRSSPDLIQMDYRYLNEYANSGVLLPLDAYLGSILNIDAFGEHNINSCRVGRRLYGVNLGINSTAAYIDIEGWAETGIEPPQTGTTWEVFIDKCKAFAKAIRRKDYYASLDASGIEIVFENWLRQRGKALYTTEGGLGFETADVTEWFSMWSEIREAGGCIPADIQVLYKHSIETSPLALGYAAMDFAHSNMFLNFQQRIPRKLGLIAFPVAKQGKPGHYYKPSQMLSVAASSQSPVAAVKLANFLVTSPKAVNILGVDRGVPASAEMRQMLYPTLDSVSQTTVEYIDEILPYVGPIPPTPPQGAGEVAIALQRISHEVSFKVMTPKKGGEQLIREASAILNR